VDDHPLAPGEDATTFFQPRGLVFVTMLWVIALVWLPCRALAVLVLLAFGTRPAADDLVAIAESLLVVPVVAASVLILVVWRRLGWLKCATHGLEFAATGRRGVHLPWAAIASVGLRRWGPFTELVVTPTDPAAVTELPGPGQRPRVLRRAAGPAFLIDVGLMSPGPKTLIEELHRRIPSRV
jgi:hypothetical protein